MVKFKSVKLNGPPQVGQVYRYWGCHQFVKVVQILPNGKVKATPIGTLRGGVFYPRKRVRIYVYAVFGQYLYSTRRNVYHPMYMRPGVLITNP